MSHHISLSLKCTFGSRLKSRVMSAVRGKFQLKKKIWRVDGGFSTLTWAGWVLVGCWEMISFFFEGLEVDQPGTSTEISQIINPQCHSGNSPCFDFFPQWFRNLTTILSLWVQGSPSRWEFTKFRLLGLANKVFCDLPRLIPPASSFATFSFPLPFRPWT